MTGLLMRGADKPKSARRFTWDVTIYLILAAVLLVGFAINPEFGTAFNFSAILANMGEIMLIAMPMTLLIISGEIDLSVASIVGLSGVVFGYTYYFGGVPIAVAAALGILTGALCGALNGFLVAKLALGSLAVTIATLALFRGFATAILGNESVAEYPEAWTNFGYDTIGTSFIPRTFPLIVTFILLFAVLAHLTSFGRRVYGIGQNVEAARFAAISVTTYKWILFILTGTMSGVAGIVYTLRFSTAQWDNAIGLELAVISVVLLGGVSIFGGIGSIWGVVGAALLFGTLEALFNLQGISPNVFTVVTGVLLISAVVIPVALRRLNQAREFREGAKTRIPVDSSTGSRPKEPSGGS